MNNIKQALKIAIEFIESTASFIPVDYDNIGIDTVKQCKAALAELDECEPVAKVGDAMNLVWINCHSVPAGTKLYTSPPQQQWVGLSDDKIFELCQYIDHDLLEEAFYSGARAVEAKLKELNT